MASYAGVDVIKMASLQSVVFVWQESPGAMFIRWTRPWRFLSPLPFLPTFVPKGGRDQSFVPSLSQW